MKIFIHRPSQPDEQILERCSDAHDAEYQLWGMRCIKLEDKPFQVFRLRHRESAGDFAELHSYVDHDEASRNLGHKRRLAAARAFIAMFERSTN